MSVEEAVQAVIDAFEGYDNCCGEWRWKSGYQRHDPYEPVRDASLAALVREVRAEMPCYRSAYTYAGGDEAFYDPRGFDYSACAETLYRGEPLCPACTARAEREALKVEAG